MTFVQVCSCVIHPTRLGTLCSFYCSGRRLYSGDIWIFGDMNADVVVKVYCFFLDGLESVIHSDGLSSQCLEARFPVLLALDIDVH